MQHRVKPKRRLEASAERVGIPFVPTLAVTNILFQPLAQQLMDRHVVVPIHVAHYPVARRKQYPFCARSSMADGAKLAPIYIPA